MTSPTEQLRDARRRDSELKRRQAREALEALVAEGAAVTFEAVRRRAGVSRSLVYNDHDLRDRIYGVRERQGPRSATPSMPLGARVSDRSLHNDLTLTRDENRQLRTEIDRLRARLGTVVATELDAMLGTHDPDNARVLHDRIDALEAELAAAHEQLTALQEQNDDLVASLDASRDNYRTLIVQANRNE